VSSAGAFALSEQPVYAKAAAGRMAPLCAVCRTGDGTIKHGKRGATGGGASLVGLIWSRPLGCEQLMSCLPLRTLIMIQPTIGCATCAAFVNVAI
jgi:hypothetical protein